MKNLFRNIISSLLIVVLLATTLQLSIYKMECMMSGKVAISLSDFEDCGSYPKDGCSIGNVCCCFHQMNLNFDYDSDFSPKFEVFIPSVFINQIIELPKAPVLFEKIILFTNLPPPSGFDLLKIVQVFRL